MHYLSISKQQIVGIIKSYIILCVYVYTLMCVCVGMCYPLIHINLTIN